ncbi:oxysterol-binding protein-related protein 6 isoform X15 [Pan paniscus]|uniref:oxysterol-binding protein-related protein 6 isoform X16 n=1 Tax=Homo sapiens TaxID=9606 RepID=UPI0007DC7977|nr:oxysterol-binding protein-related protein 6 isoform X16 [Homo sapiens]XP_047299121.1 oxysterol-binding protein-related protein 6 isoform X16 [Homo sapiens]XP_047299122.1 oxysterol-binding protein-related protein 6 isoform X16 [Homo sapiens]XP_054196372.1 oxysterol-binding protein-related protein 6 isoform X16 [Homo sapiens]XP_054196373.1 oxysterol-binding protein-related protein 6 isoform X16 [Homo sapiens]XP_054196375.1 oxysterol-binding protein-related protein 6 isoform X16 [Homo sapiens]|eukprot:XP_016858763.1 oxysterol-binding protein-related protein 6 isoform X9 [Homo sapiens]
MSSDEKGISPAHKTSTPTHRSASSSTSSQRDSRQSIHILERTASSSTEPSVSRQLLEPEPVPLSKEADSWEIIEGLKIGQTNVQKPDKHEGFMLKKRKWPLKGWHKRFFVLDNGMLKYSKAPLDIQKGKVHGSIDVGLSVMSIKKKARRIDLDTEEHIYHLKVKSQDWFDAWVSKLRHHRLYRQNEIVRSPRDASFHIFPSTSTAESSPAANVSVMDGKMQPNSFPWQSPLPCSNSLPATCTTGQSKVAAWLQDSEEMDRCAEDLAHCQSNLVELSKLLQNLEILQRTQSAPNFTDMQVPFSATMSPVRLHSSNPNLCADIEFQTPPSHLTDPLESSTDYTKLQEEFCLIAQKVHSLLKSAFNSIAIEKEKLKQMVSEQDHSKGHSTQMARLRQSLSQAGEQIHVSLPLSQQVANESRLSMSESVSEFFDAQEVLLSASSSENEASDDESYISDVSDNISEDNTSVADNISRQILNGELTGGAFRNGRRACLPAPCPDTSNINLWNILRNNIGKDLSKVSMPVELNEPLNTLQHLCEEMEYSELLDKASETDDPYERMVLVAAFAVSGYCSTYFRAGSKPFNPVLGETYECIREDKGFRFFSEQVSHHPPISACHCESKNFVFWQDIRWKNKFWGKSMEILPVGTLNVMLPKYGDYYVWNKVTTCIHNILSGRRWIEHYGEVTIRNTKSSVCICKLTFVKVNYWNSNMNEVQGVVIDQEGKAVYRLFGKWHEGLYCGVAPSAKCIWRPGSMPTNYELYYGFTRFAIELNELDPVLKDLLPPTDARFRPDQRFLEEGNLEAAASEKQRVEELQRSRRRYMEENNLEHIPKFFKKVIDANQREAWVSNDTYWELRKDPGFSKVDSPVLW